MDVGLTFIAGFPLSGHHGRYSFCLGLRPTYRASKIHRVHVCEDPLSKLPPGEGGKVGSKQTAKETFGFVADRKMGIAFTCNICNTRISKMISRKSYETGVVLIQCSGCKKRHVIADNLGYFSKGKLDGKKNVEEFAASKGQSVTRVSTDVFNLEKLISERSDEESSDSPNK